MNWKYQESDRYKLRHQLNKWEKKNSKERNKRSSRRKTNIYLQQGLFSSILYTGIPIPTQNHKVVKDTFLQNTKILKFRVE